MKEVQEETISNDLEEAARKIATRHSHITGDTYYANDAWFFKKGAQWQKEQMIDKAIEWLCHNYDKYIRVIGSSIYPAYAELCKDFQKAMEE